MSLKEISKPIDVHLKQFNVYFRNLLHSDIPLLNLILRYIARKKGKMIRPILVFLSADLSGGVTERTYVGASMVELLHIATLIHDDVVDESAQRRGLPSINAIWNNKISVLIGDYLLAKGLLVSTDKDSYDFLSITSKAVKRMSEGELLQIQKSRKFNIDEKTYLKIISDKTAALFSICCEIGCKSSTENEEQRKLLSDYGEFLGLAFQIKDDILDYQGISSVIGKPVGNDLKEKKMTLPLINSLAIATKNESGKMLSLIKKKNISNKDLKTIINFVKNYGGIEYSEKIANNYARQAIACLDTFPECTSKDSLISLANFVTERNK